jgi:hypothetical protein
MTLNITTLSITTLNITTFCINHTQMKNKNAILGIKKHLA